jgi:hypothetical protein
MNDERPPEVLGALPHTRPHRRSDKRAARPEKDAPATPAPKRKTTATSAKRAPQPKRLSQPAQPAGAPPKAPKSPQARRTPASPPARRPNPPSGGEILGTAVQAAAELAEIGLTASARALRNALSRLPRP